MFSADYYKNNRLRVLQSLSDETLVVAAGHTKLQLSADLTYPFRQDSSLRYLCGIEEPDIILVFSEHESFIIAEARSDFRSLWDGQQTFESIAKQTGVDEVVAPRYGWSRLSKLMKKYDSVGILGPVGKLPWGGAANPARAQVKTKLKRRLSSKHSLIDIRKQLAELRTRKQPAEIEALQCAADITAEGYTAVAQQIGNLAYEYELQAVFSAAFEAQNARHAYDPIIASGPRSCVLHYTDSNQPIEDNLVLFDVAAEVDGYHCDVSRTMPHFGSFSTRQQAVYDAVLHVQKQTIKDIKLGMTFMEVDQRMREHTAEALVKLGLSKKASIDDTKIYLPHSSHFIGLDVHDVGDYQAPLASGSVFTIEPGIYIPDEGIGVRIEDVIHLTAEATNVLTRDIPK